MDRFSNGQMVLTKALERKLTPPTEGGEVAQVKFFTTFADWTWYAAEYDPDTRRFFGLVVSPYARELGYWTLDDLMSIQFGYLGVERDKNWEPMALKNIARD